MKKVLFFVVACVLLLCLESIKADIPKLINYQGMLTDNSGSPLTDTVDITFIIYDDPGPTGGNIKWDEIQYDVPVINGLFNVILGSENPINLDFSEDYWMEITVGGQMMPGRLRFTSVGYAYRALIADSALSATPGSGSNWSVSNSVLYTNEYWGIARGGAGNVLYGDSVYSHVNLGMACTTGTNGANHYHCIVGGGKLNSATDDYTTVGGGIENRATDWAATIAGGYWHLASGYCATIGGGEADTASADYATVGGGYNNRATDYAATVGGGYDNLVNSDHATVAGGSYNSASGLGATVGGGSSNAASNDRATVSGGSSNTASGEYATVGGGFLNTASGNYSFAAGRRAKANHHGCFVWADMTNADFSSTDTNQFLIRASGGVGIGTTSPGQKLDVDLGDIVVQGAGSFDSLGEEGIVYLGSVHHYVKGVYGFGVKIGAYAAGDVISIREISGNVGIGTTSPAYKLDVNGDINVAGSYNVKKGGVNYTHPDYVFEPDYKLMPLDELKKYVLEKKCLPNVISAEDVKRNSGFKIDELLIQMLEKIEEQTLYIIQLEERIAKLEKER